MRRHILVLNRFDNESGRYHRYIDHGTDRVAYITSRAGARPIDATLAETVVIAEDLTDWEDVHALAKDIVDRYGPIDELLALSEFDLELGAWLRERLGVSGLTVDDIRRVRDKVTMKTLVSAAGLRVPRFVAVDSPDTGRQFAASAGFPLILKPRSGWDSQGVFLVRSQRALEGVLAEQDLADYEIEEFIAGDMYHVDGLVRDGRVQVLRSARMIASCLDFALGKPSGSVANDDEGLERRFLTYTERVLSALQIRTSAFHLEVFRTADEPTGPTERSDSDHRDLVFLEIGARVGGAQIPHLWREVYNVDLVETWVRMLLGEDPELAVVGATSEVGGYVLIPEPPVRPCRVTGTSSLVGRIPEMYAEILPATGAILAGTGGGKETAGQFRFRGPTSSAVEQAIWRTVAEYSFDFEPLTAGTPTRALPPERAVRRAQAVACA